MTLPYPSEQADLVGLSSELEPFQRVDELDQVVPLPISRGLHLADEPCCCKPGLGIGVEHAFVDREQGFRDRADCGKLRGSRKVGEGPVRIVELVNEER